jgi:hypothetical protein
MRINKSTSAPLRLQEWIVSTILVRRVLTKTPPKRRPRPLPASESDVKTFVSNLNLWRFDSAQDPIQVESDDEKQSQASAAAEEDNPPESKSGNGPVDSPDMTMTMFPKSMMPEQLTCSGQVVVNPQSHYTHLMGAKEPAIEYTLQPGSQERLCNDPLSSSQTSTIFKEVLRYPLCHHRQLEERHREVWQLWKASHTPTTIVSDPASMIRLFPQLKEPELWSPSSSLQKKETEKSRLAIVLMVVPSETTTFPTRSCQSHCE